MTHRSLTALRSENSRGATSTRGRLVRKTMSTKTPTQQNGTALDPDGIRRQAMLGIDDEGREHYWSAPRQRLYVLDDGAVAHVRDIDDRPLSDWVAYIETHVGWTDLFWSSESALDQLVRRLSESVQ
jgi:hypothetical protein